MIGPQTSASEPPPLQSALSAMLQYNSKIIPKNHSVSADPIEYVAITALCIAVGLWIASALGFDPTNVPQRLDFEGFHLPSVLVFAEQPFSEAIGDYPAAPFPLFYL